MIELPNLPIPSALPDPRQEAIAATVDELDRLGVAHVTILVASGLRRRPSPREIGLLVPPEFRRRFRGRLIVHDAESEELVDARSRSPGSRSASPPRSSRPTSSSRSRRPRPSCTAARRRSLRACSREVLRASGATSLLETSSSQGWSLAVELERLLAARAPVYGISLVLNLPHVFGGYPYDEQSLERIARSKLRRGLGLLPAGGARARIIERVPRELTAAAVLGGTPSAAHTEALLRAIEFKAAALAEPLDAIVIGIPPTTPFLPRGAAEPGLGGLPRARARAAALAQRVPGDAGRHGDPAPRLPAPLPGARADALPRALRRSAHAPATATRSARPSGRRSPTSARSPTTAAGRSVHPLEPFVALERLRRSARAGSAPC